MKVRARSWSILCFLCLLTRVSSNPKPRDETTPEPVQDSTEPPVPTTEPPVPTTETPVAATEPTVTNSTSEPVIAVGVNTGDKLHKWGQAIKNAVKKPSEIAKDSVNVIKDGVKMGTEFGEATVSKGIAHLGKQGVATVTDLGKMGINMSTTLANNTLGIIHKIGDMMPIGGRLVKNGVSLGRKGLSAAKALSENFLDNLFWWADNGFGWLSNTASQSKSFFHNKTDNIASTIEQGIDDGAGRIGDMISAGINKLPIFKVNASLTLG